LEEILNKSLVEFLREGVLGEIREIPEEVLEFLEESFGGSHRKSLKKNLPEFTKQFLEKTLEKFIK